MSSEARNERNALALQRVARRLERRSYHQADLVVCVSEELRELLVAELAVDRGKVVVIPNAVDLGRFSPAGVSAGDAGSGDDLVIGFVGFVIERQGLDELIRAVALLRGRGVPVRATIVGDGPDRARLERLAADTGVPEAVTFVGQVSWEDVPRWIRSFSVGYSGQRGVGGMPMYHSPLKIYEYLAMARPVVASHHVDAERALIASRSGWTFAAGDLDALVDTLEQVVALPPADLAGYGSRARAHVEAHHGWQHRVRQLVDELRTRGLVHADGGAAVERNP